MQDNQDKDTSTDEVQSTREYKKIYIPAGARFPAPVQIDPGAHPAFCTMGTGCLSRG
jgi:hypothetical protein